MKTAMEKLIMRVPRRNRYMSKNSKATNRRKFNPKSVIAGVEESSRDYVDEGISRVAFGQEPEPL